MMNDASARVRRPSPPRPSGFVTHSVFWSGPGLKAVATRVTMPVVTATQPTKRQRGLGGAPVGNSSGTKLNSATRTGIQAQFSTQSATSAVAWGPGSPNAACQ